MRQASRTSPRAVAGAIVADLVRNADPKIAEGSRRFFKKHEGLEFIGVRAPTVRAAVRAHVTPVKHVWTLLEAMSASKQLARRLPHEIRIAGFIVLGQFRRKFTPAVLETIEEWLDAGAVTDWATTDGLCLEVVSPLLKAHPDLIPTVAAWRSSSLHWRRRTAAVALVPFARAGEHLDQVYTVVTDLLEDPEDLMHKACGWLLREAGKTDRSRLERYLLKHGTRVPRTAVRYAIEHFPEKRRRAVLEETKGRRE